jgi:hypothetical protein
MTPSNSDVVTQLDEVISVMRGNQINKLYTESCSLGEAYIMINFDRKKDKFNEHLFH